MAKSISLKALKSMAESALHAETLAELDFRNATNTLLNFKEQEEIREIFRECLDRANDKLSVEGF